MIRFYDRALLKDTDMDIIMLSEQVVLDETIWNEGRGYFKSNLCCHDAEELQLLPVVNKDNDIICYAYQDGEANRELRMLRELTEALESNKRILQFREIFPDIHKVIVCGCNELAWYFVKYLENQHIDVEVRGKYWDHFGYGKQYDIDMDGADQLVIYAETCRQKTGDLYQTVIRSVSSEFECIDSIYEANVLAENIKDTVGNFTEVIERLKGKDIVILGTDTGAQDTYDLLYEQGIDISGFADWTAEREGEGRQRLLGKDVLSIQDAVIYGSDKRVFINSVDSGSALGTKDVEFFDYYGYKRNEQFIFLRDYVEVPCRNLVYVLKDKKVRLVGDERLCILLSDYLEEIENGNIDVALMQSEPIKEDEILCLVYPWYGAVRREDNPKLWDCQEGVLEKNLSYTTYFSNAQAFVLIDAYRNRGREKYSLRPFCPKGILLGRIPVTSGNVFFRGLLDGHPNILKWDYTALEDNLFLYCIRLSNEKSEDILSVFKEMYEEEFQAWQGADFTDWNKFEASVKRLLAHKERFTSQELFVIFFIAYTEMVRKEEIKDIGNMVIYWEPHNFPREDFHFLAEWLKSEKINGNTIFMHRDNMVRAASCYKTYKSNPTSIKFMREMSVEYILEMKESVCSSWEELHVRFEDIKLHPKEELLKVCNKIGIPWSDTMLKTTQNGESWEFWGSLDFDLKPVFNRYEETLSEFDRFRISLLSSPYQNKYGYTYEDCLQFSRNELMEMFLRPFRFQQKLHFGQIREERVYYLQVYDVIRWQLWNVRKHTIRKDITPQFGKVQIGEASAKDRIENLKQFIAEQKDLILYGIGNDCEVLWENLNELERSKCLFCDMRAEREDITFHGKKVAAPDTLCKEYEAYKILVTPSAYYKSIQYQLEEMGVCPDRIICNTYSLWGEKR